MHAIRFKAEDGTGKPVPRAVLETLYLCSPDYARVFKTNRLDVADGRTTLAAPSQPFQVTMILPVEGFGAVYCYADNEGEGYAGTEGELDFCYEAARTRLTKLWKWLREQQAESFTPSSDLLQRIDAAEKHFREEDSLASLRESLWAGELAVLEKARRDIDSRGRRDEFLFGCNCFGHPELGPRYDELFLGLLNFATVPLYWNRFEPERGKKDWPRLDELADWLAANGVTAKGHPLVCFFSTPDWAKDLGYGTFRDTHREEICQIVDRYRGRIDIFDVINEAHDWANELGFTRSQLVDMTRLACDATREANPGAARVVNSCEPWGNYAATTTPPHLRGAIDRPLTTPERYLEQCLDSGIDFEVMGLQLYYGYGGGLSCHDIFELNLMLDRFARFGKPIQITEVGYMRKPSGDIAKAVGGPLHWHRPWDDEVHAEWVEALYTLCYSKPSVNAVTWWSFEDGEYGGLVAEDLSPKPAYHRLKELIGRWQRMA